MTEACKEAYPAALRRGRVIECEKVLRHWKHENKTEEAPGSIAWWGGKLTDEEQAEAERIRALGGTDHAKELEWLERLSPAINPVGGPDA